MPIRTNKPHSKLRSPEEIANIKSRLNQAEDAAIWARAGSRPVSHPPVRHGMDWKFATLKDFSIISSLANAVLLQHNEEGCFKAVWHHTQYPASGGDRQCIS